jgi:hypothetical protein
MYETMYQITAAVGGISLLFALGLYRLHDEVELFATVAFGAWAILAFASDNLVVLDQTGATHTFGSFAMQLLCAGLALVSALAVIGAVTGEWPADSSRAAREAPV